MATAFIPRPPSTQPATPTARGSRRPSDARSETAAGLFEEDLFVATGDGQLTRHRLRVGVPPAAGDSAPDEPYGSSYGSVAESSAR